MSSRAQKNLEIHTPHLTLTLQTREECLASIDALPALDKAEVSPVWLDRVKASTTPDPWLLSFSAVHRESGVCIGGCGYKGPPDANGVVEIAYGVDAAHQGRGYGTEMAQALVAWAFQNAHTRTIRAHTRPGNAASSKVLAKCRFDFVGEVMDPEDGLVARWELRVNVATARPRRRASREGGPNP